MQRNEVINLIKDAPGVKVTSQTVWADFGSGDGAFTLALRELGGPSVKIYSIDKSSLKLHGQKKAFEKEFPDAHIDFIKKDFTKPISLPPLDGILMANSLHFIKDQAAVFTAIKKYLKPNGTLVIVEYNIVSGNAFVPYPISFEALGNLVRAAGFKGAELMATAPSQYWDEIYSAKVGQ